ncbi:MAG: 4-hydroxy-3-methylbut-2-enyl diphosphate reductase [Nitrospinae bacterium]|nr:4-hydroxy-3-methylbut-2-enyl diphosphate reductase [Nitrospinota bacterium]
MRVKLAKTAGFCWGVERALDIALDTANDASSEVLTHGPLIHNPQTVELLEQKSVIVSEPQETPSSTSLVVIRAHGISPQVRDRLRSSGAGIRDATCPLVAKVHGVIRKHSRMGAFTVIIGEEDHPEVDGHKGYAEAGSHLITCMEDVSGLPDIGDRPVVVVAQTTINMREWKDVEEAILRKYPQAQMFNTICDATEVRQEEVKKLAPDVDLMVVVGGRNSGNTNRLMEVAKEGGADSILVETEDEIDEKFLQQYKNIAVTAGASTPDWMIRRVVNRIEAIPDPNPNIADKLFDILKVLSRANVLLFLSAILGSIAITKLGGFPLSMKLAVTAGLYLFAAHTMNRCVSYEADRYNEPNRALFYEKHKPILLLLSGIAALVSIAFGMSISYLTGGILVAGLMWAIFCSLKLEPRAVVGRVLNFPALKILVLASGWTFSLAVLPALANSQAVSAGWMVSIFFAFGLIFFRTGLMELRDIQGDRIVGKRTLPIVFGKVQTETLMGVICAALAVTLVSACINEWVTPSFGYLMLIPVMYAGACLYWYTRKILGHSGLMEVAADQIFIIAGVLALLMV